MLYEGTKMNTIRESENQLVIPFDFWEKEQAESMAQEQKEIAALKSFDQAGNDNERLFNLQKDFYANGSKKALQDMFIILEKVALKLIRKECREKKFVCPLDRQKEMALDATALMIEQFIKNKLKIHDSFISYLFLQVRKTMYDRTKAQRLEAWCKKKNLNFFTLTDKEKETLKQEIEEGKDKEKILQGEVK
jgi:hypothetical protein